MLKIFLVRRNAIFGRASRRYDRKRKPQQAVIA
jgi:hypothetical protein